MLSFFLERQLLRTFPVILDRKGGEFGHEIKMNDLFCLYRSANDLTLNFKLVCISVQARSHQKGNLSPFYTVHFEQFKPNKEEVIQVIKT